MAIDSCLDGCCYLDKIEDWLRELEFFWMGLVVWMSESGHLDCRMKDRRFEWGRVVTRKLFYGGAGVLMRLFVEEGLGLEKRDWLGGKG